ncbi:isoamyl acetate-hydrolyzing esterase [Coemansia sp. RSA 2440]|nr:isoamyl acetate-hydrolyzing esterase [Coemansia sp. RSA 2440]
MLLCMTIMIAYTTCNGPSSMFTGLDGRFMRRDVATTAVNMTYSYPTYDILMVLGDSNTQFANDPAKNGFVAQLAEFYQRQMDVLNRGFRGYNTSSAREIIGSVLPKTSVAQDSTTTDDISPLFKFAKKLKLTTRADEITKALWPYQKQNYPGISNILQLIIILFGTNDSRVEWSEAYNPIDQYAEDLQYFITLLQDPDSEHYSPDARIMIITPPVVGDRKVQELAKSRNTEPEWYNNRTQTYAAKAIEVAQAANVAYVDLHTGMEDVVAEYRKNISSTDVLDGYDNYLIDGIHLNVNGSAILFGLIHDTIAKNWPEMIPLKS